MAGLQEYKCPCCGGSVTFNPDLQKMQCPFCGTEFEMQALEAYNATLQKEGSDDYSWSITAGSEWKEGETDGIVSMVCKSCGGEIVGDRNTAATACPYCGNPVVVNSSFEGMLKPDYIIPFKLDKAAAKEKLKKHFAGKKLLPRTFKDGHHLEEVKGIYVPYWLYDAKVSASVRYKGTKENEWEDSEYKYKETKYFHVARSGNIAFEKVPVDGSSKMDDTLMESLEPYNFKDAVPFQKAYLSGYVADRYDVDAETSRERANERIKRSTERAFEETVTDYDSVETENSVIRLDDGKAQYALYPVWLLNTTWNGRKYPFAMNGQTGKFVGDLPMDKGLFWKYFGATAGIAAVVCFLIQLLFALVRKTNPILWGKMAIIALVIGLIIGIIRALILKGSLVSVHKNNEAADYVKAGSFKLTDKVDRYIYSKTEKEEKPKENKQ